MQRITVTQAAAELGISPQLLRISMINGTLPIGMVLGEGNRKTYVIYAEKVEKVLQEA